MKILLAADESECSERAARFITRFHFSPGDEIILLHVISEIPYDDDSYANIRHHMKRVAPHILRSAADILHSVRAKVVQLEVEGYPDNTIMEEAENANADLIVMGTIGRSGLSGLLIGSTAEKVIDQVNCSVLTIKPANFQSPITIR